MKDISVVVPLFNEEESLPELHAWIAKVMNANLLSYEILFVDDGSQDNSWEIIEQLASKDANVRGFKFRRNYGKSAALNVGFRNTKGEVVITMDADLQDSPDEIPELYNLIKKDKYHLISGWKKKRYDPLSKTIPTKLFNWATRKMCGVYLHDFNCGLKAYDHRVVKSVEVYGEMHRYIPVLAKQVGFAKIGEKVVQHRARQYGVTKFGMDRFVNGFLDLLSVSFMGRFGKKPMHFFGILGVLMFIVGFGLSVFIGGQKLFYIYQSIPAPRVTDIPYFYIALVTMLIGTQFFLSGFVAELVSRSSADRNNYLIEKDLD